MSTALSGAEAQWIHLIHLQVVVEDLEKFLDVGDITGLELGPDRNIIQCDLEGARGQEVSLQYVTEEERHQTGEDLVVLAPDPGVRRGHTHHVEGVLAADDQYDGQQLQV